MALKYRALDTSDGREKFVAVVFGTWVQEVPSGTVDGANTDFVLANAPTSAGSTIVFVDSVIVTADKYTVNTGTKTITFNTAPSLGQDVYVVYLK